MSSSEVCLTSFAQKFFEGIGAFLTDMDGTILKSTLVHYLAWFIALRRSGLKIGYADFVKHFEQFCSGGTDDHIINMFREFLPDSINASALATLKENILLDLVQQYPELVEPIEGAVEFIRCLKSLGIKIVVVTNCTYKTAKSLLEAANIFELVDLIVTPESVGGRGKPDPAPYDYAVACLGLHNGQVVCAEDSQTGITSVGLYRALIKILANQFADLIQENVPEGQALSISCSSFKPLLNQ